MGFGCDSVVTVLTTLTLVGTAAPRPESIGSDDERSPAMRWLVRGLVTTDEDPGGEVDACIGVGGRSPGLTWTVGSGARLFMGAVLLTR